MSVPELTDAEAEIVALRAVRKLMETDDWEIIMAGHDPALNDVKAEVVLPRGRRVSVHVTLKVFDHDFAP